MEEQRQEIASANPPPDHQFGDTSIYWSLFYLFSSLFRVYGYRFYCWRDRLSQDDTSCSISFTCGWVQKGSFGITTIRRGIDDHCVLTGTTRCGRGLHAIIERSATEWNWNAKATSVLSRSTVRNRQEWADREHFPRYIKLTGQGMQPPLSLSAPDSFGSGRRLISVLAIGCLSVLAFATGG